MFVGKPRVLVAGATGYIGGRLVPRLLAAGHPVVCLARDPRQLEGRWPGVSLVAGDLLDEGSLDGALEGVDTAYYLVHSMSAGEEGFAERDRRAAAAFGAASRRAGVRHIIYLGGLGVPPLSAHLASRQETGRVLRESGIPVTEFRAGIIVGAGSTSFELMRHLVERLPVMVCPRWVNTACQPIAVDDVIRYLGDCLAVPEARGRILEIGGGDVLTYRDLMLEYAAVRGLKRRLVNVPLLAAPLLLVRSGDPDRPSIARPHQGQDRGGRARPRGARDLRLRAARLLNIARAIDRSGPSPDDLVAPRLGGGPHRRAQRLVGGAMAASPGGPPRTSSPQSAASGGRPDGSTPTGSGESVAGWIA
jgi:uncharacterized protein YbjT (DUF2867 family)